MKRFRILHIIIIVYLIAAFSWWAILLYKKNEETYLLKKELSQLTATIDLTEITETYEKQKKMILGEGAVFGISILFGLILINRAFLSELKMNKRLNAFLLSVTHELKTPIASLKLANKTLSRKDLPKEKFDELLESSHEDCLRLEDQVNNILTAAQLEQAYTFNFESDNLSALIERSVQKFSNIYQRDIRFADTLDDKNAQFDREAIKKVIGNLLHNAVKYSEADTVIMVKIDAAQSDIKMTVANQGMRIPETEKVAIWQKFYRVGSEETRNSPGTGLGLWIVKSIIEAHKGSVKVIDNKPSGSAFIITIPQRQ